MSRNILGIPLDQNQPWPAETAWIVKYNAVFFAFSTALVLQRLAVPVFKIHGSLGLDDALITAGWLCGMAYFIETTLVIKSNPTGSPLPPQTFEYIALLLWLIEMAFMLSQCFIKLSVLAILDRLVRGTYHKNIRIAIYSAAILTAGYSTAIFIALFLLCRPVPAYWRAFNPHYAATHKFHCRDQTVSNLLAGIVAVISDLYTIAIPWFISRTFNMSKKQTLALNLVFTSGLIVTAASCLRTYHLYYVFRGHQVPPNIILATAWSTVEIQLAIMCACMPSLRVFYRKVLRPLYAKLVPLVTGSQHISKERTRLGDGQSMRELAIIEDLESDAVISPKSSFKDGRPSPISHQSDSTLK